MNQLKPPTTQHPFIDGLKKYPEGRKKELSKVKSWLTTQPHLPSFPDEYIYLFLHACYYNVDKAKNSIEAYCTVRTSSPTIFDNRDPFSDQIKTVADLGYLVRMPKSSPEGYRILLYSVRDPDPTRVVFSDVVKGFCMYNDCVISEDGLAEGYVVLFDMRGIGIGHLARVNLQSLRTFMVYIQEAHPARLKAIHVLNTPSWIHHVMRIVLPMVKSDLISLVKFHKGSVPDDGSIPLSLLPSDYGGEAPSVATLDNESKSLTEKYTQWLLDSAYYRADESKRVKKSSWGWGGLFGTSSTTTADKLDEKSFMNNLQID